MAHISVIIPTFNEENYISETLQTIFTQQYKGRIEVIIADGGSKDRTLERVSSEVKVINCSKGRAIQLNAAAEKARGEILFFIHADMKLPPAALTAIKQKIQDGYEGGGFANNFSQYNFRMKIGKKFITCRFLKTNSPANRAFFGDNGIFVKREVFQKIGGFKEIPIMEDFEFTRKLMQNFRVIRIMSPQLIVSTRRFEKNGYLRTHLLWYLIIILYRFGVSPFALSNIYKDIR